MKTCIKTLIFLCLCIFCIAGIGLPDAALSAPQGKLVVAQGGDPTTCDPHTHSETYAFNVLRNIYDHLISRTFDKDGNLKHLPMLATSWEPLNNTTWIFHLRKGVQFHNGEEFNAEAVKYSIERVLNPAKKARYRKYFTQIDKVEIIDPYTVKITTKIPMPTLIINLAYGLSIVPPKYFEEKGDEYVASHPIGTGPYKFVRWIKDDEIVMEANEDWWGGPPSIKTLTFKPIPESSTKVAALMGGGVDIIDTVPVNLIPMIDKSKIAKVVTQTGAKGVHIHLNSVNKGPFKDRRVRLAANYAVNKESIVKNILEGYGKPLGQPGAPCIFGYNPDVKPFPFDPEKARILLKEAGYDENTKPTVTFASPNGRYPKDKEFAEAVTQQLEDVGFKVKLTIYEWGNYTKSILHVPAEKSSDMCIIGWASSFDGDAMFSPLLRTAGVLSRYSNPELDKIIDEARSIVDPNKRLVLYRKANKMVHDDGAWLFMHYNLNTYGVNNQVMNWRPSPYQGLSFYMVGPPVNITNPGSPSVK